MLCQPRSGNQLPDSDLQEREILYLRHALSQILAENTGQSIEKINQDTEQDFFLSAQAAQDYGIIDQIIDRLSNKSHASPTVPITALKEEAYEAIVSDRPKTPQSSHCNAYAVLDVAPDTPIAEIPKVFAKAVKLKQYPAEMLAKARKQLMNPKTRIIADYFRPLPSQEIKGDHQEDFLESADVHSNFCSDWDQLELAIAAETNVSEIDMRVGETLANFFDK